MLHSGVIFEGSYKHFLQLEYSLEQQISDFNFKILTLF